MNKKYMMLAALCGFAVMAVKSAEEVYESPEGVQRTAAGLHLTAEEAEQLMVVVKELRDKAAQAELRASQAEERARVAADQVEQTEELLRQAMEEQDGLHEKNRIIKQLTEKLQRSEARRNDAEVLVAKLEGQLSKTQEDLKRKATDLKTVLGVLADVDQQGEQAAQQDEQHQALMEQAQKKIKALEAKHELMQQRLLQQQQEKDAKAFEVQQLRSELSAFSVGSGVGLRKQCASAVSLFQAASTQEEQDQKEAKQAKVKELEEGSVQVSKQVIEMQKALVASKQDLKKVKKAFEQVQQQNQQLAQEKAKLAAAKTESDVALVSFKAGLENISKDEMKVLVEEIEAQQAGQVVPVVESDDQKTITFDEIKRSFLRLLLGTRKYYPRVKS